jgi:two-component system nitrogen regulation response regulator GlnG
VEVKDLPHDLTHGKEFVPPVTLSMPAAAAPVASTPPEPISFPAPQTNNSYSAMPLAMPVAAEKPNWVALLESEAASMLAAGQPEVMDALGRQFESALIKTALKHTHGRKNDAAVRLGIGRNTITRKIHELGIDGAKDE